MNLTKRILIAMALAVVLGSITQVLLSDDTLNSTLRYLLDDVLANGLFFVIGKIFVASLKVLVVPLVFVSLVCGVCHLKDQSSLGLLSLKTIGLYIITTGLAISLALFLATLFEPGSGVSLQTEASYKAPAETSLKQVFINIFPTNPIAAMAEGKMLQVIVFAVLIGLAIGRAGTAGDRIGATFNDWNEVLMKLVTLLMSLAPYGVFALLFSLFAKQGLGTIGDLAIYMLTVVSALAVHAFVVYPLILKTLTGLSPLTFLKKMRNTQLFAFSTASSNATLPITLRTVEQRLGADNRVASFAVPLGATINMDGTAIMQGVATVFIAQAFALDLALTDYLLVIVTAMLASIGTAGVPGVGLVTLALVLQQVGLPVEGIALIIGVDRILDMIRTAVNVTGDAMVSVTVAHSEGALDKAVFDDAAAGDVKA
ncbi:dicarboxylate/amino acid:cation symporter [Bacterioplanoides sp. SCSIO 12839]|uniref:dicarboxylate/amino acid:cation symporter n=1 Tax=Bacterioplanoides sp. SCSIO 12839 TaxID=2829569 RepID=UPI0021030386|nr:dicarboxylate/amino acid:cation symporter [Bacterioplanoides sp. SCSIO 12839]UTW47988.1 dicarboxylate/amino acid:cation symporter [Bacterioplanoides sp. SCSIO 12839]